MRINSFKVGKSSWRKEWGEIPYRVLWISWTGKDSERTVGISTPRLNYDGGIYILPTISYRNAIPAGHIRKVYKHWTITLSFLRWGVTLCDFQRTRIPDADPE